MSRFGTAQEFESPKEIEVISIFTSKKGQEFIVARMLDSGEEVIFPRWSGLVSLDIGEKYVVKLDSKTPTFGTSFRYNFSIKQK